MFRRDRPQYFLSPPPFCNSPNLAAFCSLPGARQINGVCRFPAAAQTLRYRRENATTYNRCPSAWLAPDTGKAQDRRDRGNPRFAAGAGIRGRGCCWGTVGAPGGKGVRRGGKGTKRGKGSTGKQREELRSGRRSPEAEDSLGGAEGEVAAAAWIGLSGCRGFA